MLGIGTHLFLCHDSPLLKQHVSFWGLKKHFDCTEYFFSDYYLEPLYCCAVYFLK